MKYTYLLIDFFTIIVPFLFSFHPKLSFHKTWHAFFPAVIITGIIFIVWDSYFTYLGIWGFNEQYLTGFEIFNLPVEEVLFFFCIPYACVFTFHCLDLFIEKSFSKKMEEKITFGLVVIFVVVASFNYSYIYTTSTFLSLALLLVISSYILKIKWLTKFYLIYAILLLPFLIVNGLLTGTGLENPVVWYNETAFMGIRIFTIPLEDVFYGMELILLNLLIYYGLLNRMKIKKSFK